MCGLKYRSDATAKKNRAREKRSAKAYHDSGNHITTSLLEGLDSGRSVDVTLGHNELDVLGVEASLIRGVTRLGNLGNRGTSGGSTTEATSRELLSELGSLEGGNIISGLLGGTENNIGLGVGALVDIRAVDDEQNLIQKISNR
jgi:hypothetical protein